MSRHLLSANASVLQDRTAGGYYSLNWTTSRRRVGMAPRIFVGTVCLTSAQRQ
jgi:hypothetical protein